MRVGLGGEGWWVYNMVYLWLETFSTLIVLDTCISTFTVLYAKLAANIVIDIKMNMYKIKNIMRKY